MTVREHQLEQWFFLGSAPFFFPIRKVPVLARHCTPVLGEANTFCLEKKRYFAKNQCVGCAVHTFGEGLVMRMGGVGFCVAVAGGAEASE